MDNENNKLIIPIYLNQKIVFDLLAIVEDGFSQIKNIQEIKANEDASLGNIGGHIGTSNIFALLNVKLKSDIAHQKRDEKNVMIQEEKIHTPVSLFSKLLSYLSSNSFIKQIKTIEDFNQTKPGDFILINGTLEKNPLISLFESFEKMMNLAFAFDTGSSGNSQQKQKQRQQQKENSTILKQISLFTESLKVGDFMDILCKTKTEDCKDITAVLQTDIDYFNNRTMNEIIDGEFYVLGKAVKIITDKDEDSINLLRNTSLSLAKEELLTQLMSGFNNEEISSAGLDIPETTNTNITGNGLLLIPIAIYT